MRISQPEDDLGIEGLFLDPKGAFGTGGGWADDGFLNLTPVLKFAGNQTERAVYMFFAGARGKFDEIDPTIGFVTYSTAAPSLDEAVRWQLSVSLHSVGTLVTASASETLFETQVLTDLTANARQTVLRFTLDRTNISDQDVIHLNLERIGGDVLDTYGSDIAVGQAGIVLQTLDHNPAL